MRSIWTGALSFGLVNIPVRLYSATAGTTLDLDMLHKKDLSPIRYAKVCRADGKEVAYDDIVKGYEYRDGDYIVLTDEDFKKANLRRTKTIDVVDFIHEDEIATMYFEKPYYLEPDKGSDKAYAVLREALKKSKKVGIAQFVLRNRGHIGVIKPQDNIIVLDQMRYTQEIKKPQGLNLPEKEIVRQKEITMALALIDQLSDHFDPKKYHDTYEEELEEIIEEKAKGHKPKAKGKAPTPTKATDLMAALRESLEKAKEGAHALT